MRFWCEYCNSLVEAPSFKENAEMETAEHNGVGEHTHCEACSANLTLAECRDHAYIMQRMAENKRVLDENGAKELIFGQKVEPIDIDLLGQAQAEEKALNTALDATLAVERELDK